MVAYSALAGPALLALERRDEAGLTPSDAVSIAAEIGYRPVLWRGYALLAEQTRGDGDDARAREHQGRMRALLERTAAEAGHDALASALRGVRDRLSATPRPSIDTH